METAMKEALIAVLPVRPLAYLRGAAAVVTAVPVLTLLLASFSAQAATLCYDNGEQYPWILKDAKGLNIVLL